MEIGLSDDQQLLRETSHRFLEEHGPLERVRALSEDPLGFDRGVWAKGAELGWYAMLVPERYGGGSISGDGLVDLAVVAEEFGRLLHPGPALATNVVASAVSEFGSPSQRDRYLPAIVAGELVCTWAFAEPDRPWTAGSMALAATPTGREFVLEGTKAYVQDAHAADLLLVTAVTPAGLAQFLVEKDTPGLEVEPLEGLDVARRLANVHFRSVAVPHDSVLGDGPASAAVEHQLEVALVLQCAETNGATAQGLDMTVQYAKERVAFGRPIGSYQALKHRMADHRMWLEGSYATTAYAARSVSAGHPDAAVAARVAKAHVGRWSSATLHDCIQLHGGIGMTWDYDLHLYFRRVISNEVLYGAPDEQQRALVDLVEEVGR